MVFRRAIPQNGAPLSGATTTRHQHPFQKDPTYARKCSKRHDEDREPGLAEAANTMRPQRTGVPLQEPAALVLTLHSNHYVVSPG